MKTLDQAIERLQKLASTNAPLGTRSTAEQQYAEAYQREVRKGNKRQIRGKYRRP